MTYRFTYKLYEKKIKIKLVSLEHTEKKIKLWFSCVLKDSGHYLSQKKNWVIFTMKVYL